MNYTDIRFADLQMLRYQVNDFDALPLRQKLYVYYLSEAALWGRDILWDQNGTLNLQIRNLLEQILQNADVPRQGKDWEEFVTYTRRVWFSNGIHHHYSTDKLIPGFCREFLESAIASLRQQNMLEDGIDTESLTEAIMSPQIMPKRVCQSGDDLLRDSSCNYYAPGISQQDAEDFYTRQKATATNPSQPVMYGMNSRLERDSNGQLYENTYSTEGLYAPYLQKIVSCLEQAMEYADNDRQREVISTLIQFYRTGDLETFDRYTIQWVNETEGFVDFTNGFTEVYGDPLGLKASWEGYVNYCDREATRRTQTLSSNAQWFEDNSPVDERFKKKCCRGVSARVVIAAMLGGDLYPSSAIGINLPNSNWVRAVHGSKSVTIGNLTHAYSQAAKGNGFYQEFVIDDATRAMIDRYDGVCDDLHTDLHECLGHGSGQMLEGVDPDCLGVYGSTIEEARADLFGLYYIADPKMVELGLTPDADAYQSQYYTYMMNGLMTQLVRIEPGCCIEEAHMRNRAIIAHWCLEQSSRGCRAMEMTTREGKTFLKINDYNALRQMIGVLLAEVQRIKSEGDFQAAKELVENYGVAVEPTLHNEIRQRYQSLNIAPYKGFINPRYQLVQDADGSVRDVTISYDEPYDQQMLRYSREYSI